MNILLLSRYDASGPSSRYRSYQYLQFLRQNSCSVTEAPLLDGEYINSLFRRKSINKIKLIKSYINRFMKLTSFEKYDLIWIEKEILPWIPAFIELKLYSSGKPIVVDYDDAVFHRYDQHKSPLVKFFLGRKIDNIMARASLVIAGNPYLAQRAHDAGAKWVETIPTVVDLARYPDHAKSHEEQKKDDFIIGWIGSPSTFKYLKQIEPILADFASQNSCEVHAIGAGSHSLHNVTFRSVEWRHESEVESLSNFDVGIMPLPDGLIQRGKCGFKLIQYMACFLPTIGSPVGVNSDIITHNQTGFLATTPTEWINALTLLKENPDKRKKFGLLGRQKVELEFDLQVTAPRLLELFSSLVN